MNQPTEIQAHEDEISLKDLIKMIQSWLGLLWKNIIWVALFGLLGGAVGFYFAFSHKPVYKAESNFIVKEGGPSGIASSLGSLGSLLGGSGGSSLDRTIAVIGSEKVIGKALLSKVEIGGNKDLVLNHYLKLEKLVEKWKKDTILSKAKFATTDTIPANFSFPQRKAFKTVVAALIGEKGIVGKSFDKKSGIVTLTVTHSNEDFAIAVNELIFSELRIFFRDQASETANMNVEILTKKVDSIQGELNSVRRQLARKTDQSLGLLLNEDKVDLKSLAVKEQILLTMYGEAQKNLETFLFMGQSASNSTALNLLNAPYSPLTPTSKSKILYSIAGFILASIFAFGFILVRRWYKNLMAS
ncbi:MAG: hypothetical protein EBZ47_08985 [Chlamydiae bacterium]|nr:hypothetical protein [Chlamydiota bacterium]